MKYKICTKCSKEKPLSEYYGHKQTHDGKQPRCKSCTKKKQAKYRKNNKVKIKKAKKEYYKKNKERYKEKRKNDYHKDKLMVFDLLGNKCVYCGCDDTEALEVNHVYGRKLNKNSGGKIHRDILNGKISLDRVELTCRICNAWHYLIYLKGIEDKWTIKYG